MFPLVYGVMLFLILKSDELSVTCLELYIFLIWIFSIQILKDNAFIGKTFLLIVARLRFKVTMQRKIKYSISSNVLSFSILLRVFFCLGFQIFYLLNFYSYYEPSSMELFENSQKIVELLTRFNFFMAFYNS